MTLTTLEARISGALGSPVLALEPLTGGCIGDVFRAQLADGRSVVVKADEGRAPRLDREAYMLRFLAQESALPVPTVLYESPSLLAMSRLPGASHFSPGAERHAAELLAALHGCTAEAFGLEQDTLIGGLPQPNPWTSRWVDFFREQRLLFMGADARDTGRLPQPLFARLQRFAADLDQFLDEPPQPALLHGDVWTTNVLAEGDRITGFLDPAVYFGHPEIELAFISLFDTFGEPFFRRYQALRPIAPGFWETRRDVYNLYPLLTHVRLFGGSYVRSVDRTLHRFGY